MIYHFSLYLKSFWPFFNVFHYLSVRAIISLLSSLGMFLLFGHEFLTISERFFRSPVREYTPDSHKHKNNKPTMGGVFILGVVVINILLWTNLHDPKIWVFLFCLVGFGSIGCWDDWNKIQKNRGILARKKFFLQLIVASISALGLMNTPLFSSYLVFPFFKHLIIDLGWFFVPWAIVVIVGASNAVNLTDGLDGLAIGSLIPNFATFSLISYLAGNYVIAHYLQIPFVASAEMAVIGTILIGTSLGFLWYNTYPAQIFMGDVGSLALGASLGMMALMAKQELLLMLSGGLFVLETVSVIVQILSVRYFKRRIFKMAPIHHHFELLGWPESKITARFGIISFVLCLLAVVTLKFR